MESLVQSEPMGRPNEGRVKATYTLAPETIDLLKAFERKSGAAFGRTIDRAVAAYAAVELKQEAPSSPEAGEKG